MAKRHHEQFANTMKLIAKEILESRLGIVASDCNIAQFVACIKKFEQQLSQKDHHKEELKNNKKSQEQAT